MRVKQDNAREYLLVSTKCYYWGSSPQPGQCADYYFPESMAVNQEMTFDVSVGILDCFSD